MKRLYWYITGLILMITCLTAYFINDERSTETIIFFPIDKKAVFQSADTMLIPQKLSKMRYDLQWRSYSETYKPAYLRQDVSLLFKNGRLEGVMKEWKENTNKLDQSRAFSLNESSIYEAITFHYGEIHTADSITSTQALSFDKKYMILSKLSGFDFFESPITKEQKEWQLTLDNNKKAITSLGWDEAVQKFSIPRSRYKELPLTELSRQRTRFLSGIPESVQEEIIGKLWEGLYKNYVLGIKKENGTIISPLGSTIPLLLLNHNKRELLVLLQAEDRTPILLRQSLRYTP
ncbi:hypothetical protein JOC77_002737 [Peribacillus deserti]|uniref:Uncharacterized protein n=1 Tax=Peribacillus deserti TaxID=673318 RepID=A0ABS2QJM4_9BACI|nr:hypothetical protein [Peribacillus deserti]MBM7693297.1 hypothetical protein [Peribacillus deserti]